MKVYAKQTPPEYQESPFQYVGWIAMYPDTYIYGNQFYKSYTDETFDSIIDRFPENKICRALSILTGKKYRMKTIRGTCQGDWQNVYFPDCYTDETINTLEIEYFNLGSEWFVWTEEETKEEGYIMYCYNSDFSGIKKEIADNTGTDPENVTLYQFTGWTKTAKYTEV